MQFQPMQIILAVGILVMLASVWRAHRTQGFEFNAFDLIMSGGRVDKIAVSFMLVLILSSWIMLDLQINGKMTEGYLGIYVGAWIAPLVSKVVVGDKNDSKN
jgi:hypothetical protein